MNLLATFEEAFVRRADGVWFAPGRVNLIGDHTDYTGGFALPFALPFGVHAVAARRRDDLVRAMSVQTGDKVEFSLDPSRRHGTPHGWSAYAAGPCWALRERNLLPHGMDIVVDGRVPIGAGLSSSAALGCAVALAAMDLYGASIGRRELARLVQYAENEFVRTPCGILDQAAVLLSASGSLTFLDAGEFEIEHVPWDVAVARGLALLLIDTRAPHRLVDGEYAARRHACERAASLLGVRRLREITPARLDGALSTLPDEMLRRRVRHVVTENARVHQVVDLIRRGQVEATGPLLTASHVSLRDDYEVTVPELDVAVDALQGAGALGARMTGGGFGGSVIALVPEGRVTDSVAAVRGAFARSRFAPPEHFVVSPSGGAYRIH